MPSLICLVQRLSLGDSTRSIVKEGEQFEVNAEMADIYIKGGIAKPAEIPKPTVKAPEPAKLKLEIPNPRAEPEPEAPVDDPVQSEETEAEKVTSKKKPRR